LAISVFTVNLTGAGLTYLWYIGSPQSKEEEKRNQEMLQWIVKKVDPQKSEEFLKEMEKKYPKKISI
jgi:hypothetical protein